MDTVDAIYLQAAMNVTAKQGLAYSSSGLQGVIQGVKHQQIKLEVKDTIEQYCKTRQCPRPGLDLRRIRLLPI